MTTLTPTTPTTPTTASYRAEGFDPRRGPPAPGELERPACLLCGSEERAPFITARDDLGGMPGAFTFVRCLRCDLVYQFPRVGVRHMPYYYDDEYLSHRKRTDWGPLTPLYERAMSAHDRAKMRIVQRYVDLRPGSEVLDLGCGAGTFLAMARDRTGARVTGVDWKDLSALPWMKGIDLRVGPLHAQDLGRDRFDLITMWHVLEHDHDPRRTLAAARDALRPGDGRLVIEVPRLDSASFRLFGKRWPGLQAPQHTAIFTRERLLAMVRACGLEVVDDLPYGAFPAYFYLFTGAAFTLRREAGLDLRRLVAPYFAGQALLAPVLLFERWLNLAMQTVVCRSP